MECDALNARAGHSSLGDQARLSCIDRFPFRQVTKSSLNGPGGHPAPAGARYGVAAQTGFSKRPFNNARAPSPEPLNQRTRTVGR